MKKLTILIVMGLLCLFFKAQSQPVLSKNGLQVGEKVPDVELDNLLNYSSNNIHLSDLKGKLLILDFWATWCSSCIKKFAQTDSLQTIFGNQILIIGVAYQQKNEIDKFFKTAKDPLGNSYKFPTVAQDSTLSRLFPHYYIPHFVWISNDRIVKAITGADEVTGENIKTILAAGQLNMNQKVDINAERPLFINDHIFIDSVLHYALLYHNYFEGAGFATTYRKLNDTVRGIAICNQPLVTIYERAVEELFSYSELRYYPNRRIIESKDSLILQRSLWSLDGKLPDKKDLYSYDLILPLKAASNLYEEMLSDLNRQSGYYGSLESRLVDCLVLKSTGGTARLKSESLVSIRRQGADEIKLTNAPFNTLLVWLNSNKIINVPVLDETGFSLQIDIEIAHSVDLQSLNQALKKYNLTLIPQKRPLTMFVLRDKPAKLLPPQTLILKS